MAEARSLERFPLHLGLGATAVPQPEFTGIDWYEAYGARHGSDGAEVQNVIARGLMIHQGSGQDSAAVRASLLQNLFADLGDGNDLLILQSNNIFGATEADGGAGGDQMMESGNLMRPARKRRPRDLHVGPPRNQGLVRDNVEPGDPR